MPDKPKVYKNPPEVRAVLARVRAEQRARAKQRKSEVELKRGGKLTVDAKTKVRSAV